MSIYDPVGSTDVRIVKDLEARIAALETLVRTVTGAPVTQASSAFFLPNGSTPATPSGGVKMYAVGGSMRVIESDGSVRQIPAQADAIANQASFISGDIAGTPTSTQYNNLRADAVATRAYGFALTTILRDAGVIAT